MTEQHTSIRAVKEMFVMINLVVLLFCSVTAGYAAPYTSVTTTTSTAFQSPSWSIQQHPTARSRNSNDCRRRLLQQAETTSLRIHSSRHYLQRDQEEQNDDDHIRFFETQIKSSSSSSSSRRAFMQAATTTSLSSAAAAACMTAFPANEAVAATNDGNTYKPAIRPTVYRVDSTIPPTLLPLQGGARQEIQILQALGRGSGTNKEAVFVDTINLNNMLNKAVFGTINQVSSMIPGSSSSSLNINDNQQPTKGPGYASFVCLGVPMEPSSVDIELAVTLLQTMFQVRNTKGGAGSGNTALGLSFLPYSTQAALDEYVAGTRSQADLFQVLIQARVAESTLQLYAPLLELAQSSRISLLAMAPEAQDIETIRQKVGGGLQNVNPERRTQYVVDPQGFIALSSDERYKLYTDRSLLKDFYNDNNNDKTALVGNFYAERILVHEAGATAMARFAATHAPEALVTMVAPINDVRYLNGINGRIPRIFTTLNPQSVVTKNAVTTILINPTAQDSLSKTRHLRLEIGTGPETLDYQTKIADYLWFTSSPKVNLIPRLMDYNY